MPGDPVRQAEWELLTIHVDCLRHVECAPPGQVPLSFKKTPLQRCSNIKQTLVRQDGCCGPHNLLTTGSPRHGYHTRTRAVSFQFPMRFPQPFLIRSTCQQQINRDAAVLAQRTLVLLLSAIARGHRHNQVARCIPTQRHRAGRLTPGGGSCLCQLWFYSEGSRSQRNKEVDSRVPLRRHRHRHQLAQLRRNQHVRALPCGRRQVRELQLRTPGTLQCGLRHLQSFPRSHLRGRRQVRGFFRRAHERQSRPRCAVVHR